MPSHAVSKVHFDMEVYCLLRYDTVQSGRHSSLSEGTSHLLQGERYAKQAVSKKPAAYVFSYPQNILHFIITAVGASNPTFYH
jgi:hypothetical protein